MISLARFIQRFELQYRLESSHDTPHSRDKQPQWLTISKYANGNKWKGHWNLRI